MFLTSIILGLLLPMAVLGQRAGEQNCLSFRFNDQLPYRRNGSQARMSEGAICENPDGRPCFIGKGGETPPNATNLNLDIGGQVFLNSTLSITPPTRETAQQVYELIGSTVKATFWETYKLYIGTVETIVIQNGSIGYAIATTDLFCYNGTLEQCPTGGWAANGTEVEACTPRPYALGSANGARFSPFPRFAFNNSTREEAERYFNATARSSGASAAWYTAPTSAAGRMEMSMALMLFAGIAACTWLL
ncbi:Hypothetical protein D9617_4g001490 [Elsinoe fawcettii]|nr:Hypothetical protein D9617_4g001490 [Elsinoe fawcettii]